MSSNSVVVYHWELKLYNHLDSHVLQNVSYGINAWHGRQYFMHKSLEMLHRGAAFRVPSVNNI